jgi:hypothetical protein
MYTIVYEEGNVYRDSDGKIVAPCESATDPDFLEYIAWVNDGNEPRYIWPPYSPPEPPPP